jgi:hypothetical protein
VLSGRKHQRDSNTFLSEDMSYRLVSELVAHGGPVRCLSLGAQNELISGCQADAPNVRRWKLLLPFDESVNGSSGSGYIPSSSSSSNSFHSNSATSMSTLPEFEEIGKEISHSHWVTAVTSLAPNLNSTFPQGV